MVFLLMVAALTWCVVGYLFNAAALREDPPVPSVAFVIAVYLPIVGSGLLGYGVYSHLEGATFAARRAIRGAVLCMLIWTIAATIVAGP